MQFDFHQDSSLVIANHKVLGLPEKREDVLELLGNGVRIQDKQFLVVDGGIPVLRLEVEDR